MATIKAKTIKSVKTNQRYPIVLLSLDGARNILKKFPIVKSLAACDNPENANLIK